MIRVALADDQPVVRMGLRVLIDREDDLELVDEADDGRTALQLARRTHPDVLLLDIRMPGMDGLAALREITADPTLADTRVIVTTFEIDQYVFEALRGGRQRLRPEGRRAGRAAARRPRGRRRGGRAVSLGDPTGRQPVRPAPGRGDAPAPGLDADRPGTGNAGVGCHRAVQPGDRRGAVPQSRHRPHPHQPRHGQAGRARPCPTRGLRGPGGARPSRGVNRP